jgi:hypothetical protein
MSRFDDSLRDALRREDPGPEFTARVLAQAGAARPAPEPGASIWRTLWFRPAKLRWALAGGLASLLVVAGGVQYRREQQVRAQGVAAKQQLVLALRVAGAKLHAAREKVQELSDSGDRGD